uniref:Ig-like domain-containing protein n=1 Tax=Anas zonorhyncha TaxID=75864 RepID=A0A8B9UIM1_9AVES
MQVASSCPLAANGSVMGFDFTLSFNKNPLVCYDPDNQRFVACNWGLLQRQAMQLAARLNNGSTWVQRIEARRQACSDLALRFWDWTVLRRTQPQVRIISAETGNTRVPVRLSCHIGGFYPPEVTVIWLHNGTSWSPTTTMPSPPSPMATGPTRRRCPCWWPRWQATPTRAQCSTSACRSLSWRTRVSGEAQDYTRKPVVLASKGGLQGRRRLCRARRVRRRSAARRLPRQQGLRTQSSQEMPLPDSIFLYKTLFATVLLLLWLDVLQRKEQRAPTGCSCSAPGTEHKSNPH